MIFFSLSQIQRKVNIEGSGDESESSSAESGSESSEDETEVILARVLATFHHYIQVIVFVSFSPVWSNFPAQMSFAVLKLFLWCFVTVIWWTTEYTIYRSIDWLIDRLIVF